jgi:hypothetical protein
MGDPINRRDAMDAEKENCEALFAFIAPLRFKEVFLLSNPNGNWFGRSSTHHHSPKTIRQMNGVEIDQQSEGPAPKSDLTQQVGFMQCFDTRNGARVYHDPATHKQFNLVRVRQEFPFVSQSQRALSLEWQAAEVEFMAKAHLVRRRQQPRPQFSVHCQRRCNDLSGQSFSFRITAIHFTTKRRRSNRLAHLDVSGLHNFVLILIQPQDEPLDPILQYRDMEVDQKPDLPAPDFEIGQHLRAVHRVDNLNSLHLAQNQIRGENVQTIAALQFYTFINDRYRTLRLMRNATQSQFVRKSILVSGFRLSRSEFTMHSYRRPDYLVGEVIVFHGRTLRPMNIGVNPKDIPSPKTNRRGAMYAEKEKREALSVSIAPLWFSKAFLLLSPNDNRFDRRGAISAENQRFSDPSFLKMSHLTSERFSILCETI